MSSLQTIARRHLPRLTRILATAAASLAIAVVGLWALSRIISDSLAPWQYFFWIPAVTYLLLAATLWLAATGLALLSETRPDRLASPLRLTAGFACALLGLHIIFIDYRLHNRITAPGETSDSIRILNWNASGASTPQQLLEPILAQDADLIITVDACCHREWALAAQEMGPDAGLLFSVNMRVLSRYPIIRHAGTQLAIDAPEPLLEERERERRIMRMLGRIPIVRHAAPPDGLYPRPDPGRAWYIEFDTREVLGRTLIVWLIDLPSDIRLSRRDVARQSMRMIRTWEGHERVLAPEAVLSRPAGPGFPAPDIIVGDFNIPRASRSLRELTLGYPHAHRLAGWGHAGTYPRHRPLVHIDHAFVGPSLRTLRYEIIDPGAGSHRMQVLEVKRVK